MYIYNEPVHVCFIGSRRASCRFSFFVHSNCKFIHCRLRIHISFDWNSQNNINSDWTLNIMILISMNSFYIFSHSNFCKKTTTTFRHKYLLRSNGNKHAPISYYACMRGYSRNCRKSKSNEQ